MSKNIDSLIPLEAEARIETVLADFATSALIEEADLTPKPALVDKRGSGAHRDLTLDLMHRSAYSLRSSFAAIAVRAKGRRPDQDLRAELGLTGRDAEEVMLSTTNGVNTHRGAIWSLGLLAAGAAMSGSFLPEEIALAAASIARIPDPHFSVRRYNGSEIKKKYGIDGARGEAVAGFPHVIEIALPTLRQSRASHLHEQNAQLDALLSIMSTLDDTCLLHRGGWKALKAAKLGARAVLNEGGSTTRSGRVLLEQLDRTLISYWASPGGSADLLAATLFIDRYSQAERLLDKSLVSAVRELSDSKNSPSNAIEATERGAKCIF